MKALLYILAAILLLAGCSPCKHIAAIQVQRQDSTHTEVVTKTYFVTDTVFVEIPAQTAERTTADSVSQLENDYATSEARINPDGHVVPRPENEAAGHTQGSTDTRRTERQHRLSVQVQGCSQDGGSGT